MIEDVSLQFAQLCSTFAAILGLIWYVVGPSAAAAAAIVLLALFAIAFISPAGPVLRWDVPGVEDL